MFTIDTYRHAYIQEVVSVWNASLIYDPVTEERFLQQVELDENFDEELALVAKEDNKVTGVRTTSNAVYPCDAVIMCTGTYLQARCIYGDVSQYTGPNGLAAANELTKHLMELGIEVRRFKTGTPARVDKRTIDFSKMAEQTGDEKIVPFSFSNMPEDLEREQVSCWLTYTNKETHKIIMDNIDRAPMANGLIKGVGPRYCPSIETKLVRFPDKERHQLFLEPEGLHTNEVYVQGMSWIL